MALNENGQPAVFATVEQALRLTWVLRKPYLVLSLVAMVPMQVVALLGLFEPMNRYTKQLQVDPNNIADFPFLSVIASLGIGIGVTAAFGFIWYRYMLLGPREALKFRLPEFGATTSRFMIYGLAFWVVAMISLPIIGLVLCLLGALVANLLGMSGFVSAVQSGLLVTASYLLFAMMSQACLVFPALTVDPEATLRKAWQLGRGAATSIMWAILVAGVPLLAISFAVHSTLSLALGIDLLEDHSVLAGGPYWWIHILLSPLSTLAMTVVFGVIALSYRDLAGPSFRPEPLAAPSYAR